MVEYVLTENLLTDAPDDFRAQVVNVQSHNEDDILERIMKIGAGLTRSDVRSVLEAQKQVITDLISDGDGVNTELFNAFPAIAGVFQSAEDSFDPTRHSLKLHLQPGKALKAAEAQARTKKMAGTLLPMFITSVNDLESGTVNDIITPNSNLKISGHRIKIVGDAIVDGVHFVYADGTSSIKVQNRNIALNNPSELLLIVPTLPVGQYKIRIQTYFSGNGKYILKTPHIFMFEKLLTVQ
ncbi:hypothetical protein FACS1894199_18080 [Bacteroidia bacterium]|nr:hypothetical protein FACS1894199_18080 [Bacteroidia bacterium]